MPFVLDEVVPWGRLGDEYEWMFSLTPKDLSGGVLDCGAGPASFTAEMAREGVRAVAVDPIYAFSGPEIRARFDAIVETVLSQVRAEPEEWTWGFHRDPDHLRANRRMALERFLADYGEGQRAGRYVVGGMPALPFGAGSFRLALCSHLLFLYSDLLSEEFHIRAVRELCRVANEVRLFPILNLRRERSAHLGPVRQALELEGWQSEVVRVRYELQRGGNEMLRLFRV